MALMTDHENSGAPGRLELVRRFVNSLDVEEGTDAFAATDGLARWLSEHGLPGGPGLTDAERERTVAFRDALREVLRAHNGGGEADAATLARLNSALKGARLKVRFDAGDALELAPADSGPDSALAELAVIAREAMLAGIWSRLKICPADDCQWAFFDRSRNHSRTWCRMEECGNRAKVRSFRQRQG